MACLLANCGASGAPRVDDAGSDGGTDTGADVGHDGGRDGGHDAARDAALDGWIAVEGVPDPTLCSLYVASPELVAATSWPVVPCADRGGCRCIVSPGGPVDTNPFRVERGHGVHDGVRGTFIVFSRTTAYQDEWVVDGDGHAVMGVRSSVFAAGADSCEQGNWDISSTHYAFDLARVIGSDGIADYMFRGALGAVPAYVTDLRRPFASGWSQEIRVDGLRAAAWMSFQVVQAVEDDGALSAITPGTGGGCAIADVIGDAIFVECSTPTNVHVQLPGGALTPMFSTGINYGLDSDGTDMAWLRYVAIDGGFQTQIWTSPHTTDPSAVVERHVADMPPSNQPDPYDLRIGFGYAVLLEQSDRLGVYRLSDGARAQIDAPTDEYWGAAFVQYVGPEEIAVTSARIDVGPSTDSQLMFIRLDSLTFVPP